MGHSPKRDHTPAGRVTNVDAATPRATLTDGLTSTSGGSASVPGCSRESMREHPEVRRASSFWRDESRSHRIGPLTGRSADD